MGQPRARVERLFLVPAGSVRAAPPRPLPGSELLGTSRRPFGKITSRHPNEVKVKDPQHLQLELKC